MSAPPPKKKIKITYFDIEGRAEPVRLALVLAGVEYTDERLKFKDWQALKPKTPYGQMPVMTMLEDEQQDGEIKAQSGAMLRHIGAEYSKTLYPKELLYPIEEAMGVLGDIRNSWAPNLYMGMKPEKYGRDKDFAKTDQGKELIKTMRTEWIKTEFPTFMGHLKQLLKRNGNNGWLASSTAQGPTIADCEAVVMLRGFTKGHLDHVPTGCLDDHPELVEYVKRFCSLSQIKGRYTDGLHE